MYDAGDGTPESVQRLDIYRAVVKLFREVTEIRKRGRIRF